MIKVKVTNEIPEEWLEEINVIIHDATCKIIDIFDEACHKSKEIKNATSAITMSILATINARVSANILCFIADNYISLSEVDDFINDNFENIKRIIRSTIKESLFK